MKALGTIGPTEEGTTARCAVDSCPWTYTTTVEGKAAKELSKHHLEEHR